MSKNNKEKKDSTEAFLSPVGYHNDDMSLSKRKFRDASDVLMEYVMDPQPTTDPLSLKIPSHLHEVIKNNAAALGLNKTQFIIRALEVGINNIYFEFENHGKATVPMARVLNEGEIEE